MFVSGILYGTLVLFIGSGTVVTGVFSTGGATSVVVTVSTTVVWGSGAVWLVL